MKPPIFSEKSLSDLEGILRFIARDKPDAAIPFVDKLEKQCELLSQFPELGQKREDLAADRPAVVEELAGMAEEYRVESERFKLLER